MSTSVYRPYTLRRQRESPTIELDFVRVRVRVGLRDRLRVEDRIRHLMKNIKIQIIKKQNKTKRKKMEEKGITFEPPAATTSPQRPVFQNPKRLQVNHHIWNLL